MEQDPEDWLQAASAVVDEIGDRVDAIGLTGQMHGSVFLDSNGKVIRPALLWNDQRTQAECDEIHAKVGRERLVDITGNPALTGFQLPKLLWLRNHEPENFSRLSKLLLPKDYIRYRMTGDHATEVSDASGVGMLDLWQRDWSQEIADRLATDLGLLPRVYESSAVTGRAKGVPVVAGAGDQAAGAVGVGAIDPSVTSVSLGTSGVAFASLPQVKIEPSGSLHTFCHATGGWHAMGVMLSCGGSVEWARSLLYPGEPYSAFDGEVSSRQSCTEGLYFLPYLAGERCPFVDPTAAARFVGLRLGHSRADLARAVLEGACFGLAGCVELLTTLTGTPDEIRVTGGGAKSDVWVQLLADILRMPCVRMRLDEGPAFGASILAGVGIGVWPDVTSASAAAIQTTERFIPGERDFSSALKEFRRFTNEVRRDDY